MLSYSTIEEHHQYHRPPQPTISSSSSSTLGPGPIQYMWPLSLTFLIIWWLHGQTHSPQHLMYPTSIRHIAHRCHQCQTYMGCSKQKSVFLQMWSSPSLVKSSESLHRKIVTALPLLRKLDYFTLAREAIIRSPLSSSTSLLEYIFQSCCTMKSERLISQPTLHYTHKVYVRRYQKSGF